MAYSNLSDEEKELYLEVLREGTTPFDRFVSRGDVEDPVDIPNPRRQIDRVVFNCIKKTTHDKTARFLPILGVAGSGKTHAFWAFKDKEKKIYEQLKDSLEGRLEIEADGLPTNWTIVYIPSPPAAVRILFHIYTCIINEIPDVIDTVSDTLVEQFGGKKKKFGIFGKADIDEVIAKAASEYPGVFADCIKALITYGMTGDNTKRSFAKRWLLGEVIEEEELDELGIQSVIERDDVCLAMIKLIAENLKVGDVNKVLVLFFDEFESPYRTYGPEAEIRFLETLKRIYNEVQNTVIIAAILKDIWERLLEVADPPFKSRMEPELELQPFSFGDVGLWFAKSQEHFWEENNLNPPMDPLFPLNEAVLKVIFSRTKGNPRETIKLTRSFVDKIIYGDVTLEEIAAETQPEAAAIKAPIPLPEIKTPAEQKIEDIIDREGLIIDVNPASVIGAAIKGLEAIVQKHAANPENFKIELEKKFVVDQKEKVIGAMVEINDKKIGIDVPSVKGFDRSGGVAAYYSAKRLVDGLKNNLFNLAIIIIPESTSGAKTNFLFEQNSNLNAFKINQEQAEELIQCALDPERDFSREAYLFAKQVTGLDIPIPEPPTDESNGEGSADAE
ncbi:MAG: BREX system ATP-binding domain-containing protein [Candidatus Hodarchaeota archaeon]